MTQISTIRHMRGTLNTIQTLNVEIVDEAGRAVARLTMFSASLVCLHYLESVEIEMTKIVKRDQDGQKGSRWSRRPKAVTAELAACHIVFAELHITTPWSSANFKYVERYEVEDSLIIWGRFRH